MICYHQFFDKLMQNAIDLEGADETLEKIMSLVLAIQGFHTIQNLFIDL